MSVKPPYDKKIGYTRKEFGAIFQLYSQNVYTGLFKDFSFIDLNGRYFISFREEAGKAPLVSIEKRRLGPDRVLFVATSPHGYKSGGKGANGGHKQLVEIARSEKLEPFIRQLQTKIEAFRIGKSLSGDNISSIG